MKIKSQQVDELESTRSSHLKDVDPDKEEELVAKKIRVEERFAKMMEPLQIRRLQLDKAKRVHQFTRDVADERLWISDRLPLARSPEYGNSLLSVQMLQKKTKALQVSRHLVTRHA